jgi:hypothetical protein
MVFKKSPFGENYLDLASPPGPSNTNEGSGREKRNHWKFSPFWNFSPTSRRLYFLQNEWDADFSPIFDGRVYAGGENSDRSRVEWV